PLTFCCQYSSIYFLVRHILGLTSCPLALCRRFQRECSVFNCMNAAAVFAPEKIYGCSGFVAFNCVPKFQFAAATRTRLADADIHGVPPRLREVRRRWQIVPIKRDFARLCQRRRYSAAIHGVGFRITKK
ncbi:MAG: hypothetical protein WBX37_24350, partial [Pseudolabrys sp.]